MIQTIRAYDERSPNDRRRILVDRIWPRELPRTQAVINEWINDAAVGACRETRACQLFAAIQQQLTGDSR